MFEKYGGKVKAYKIHVFLLLILILVFAGCSSKSANVLKPEYEKNWTKVIAILPVENKTDDNKAPQLLRSKLLEQLYFKGYSKLPLATIDQRLESLYISDKKGNVGVIAPQVLKDLVDADAVMYCTLLESSNSIGFFYAPVTISLSCELRKAESGEVLWKEKYKSTDRNFDFTRKNLEMKSCETYESVIEEVVNKIIETLPDGPNLRG
ncbi:MAG: GNA1162 family protein [Smithellaceae bacterium]